MHTHHRRTLVVLASLLAVAVTGAVIASSAWWSPPPPDSQPSATASSPTGRTSSPSASTAAPPTSAQTAPTPSASLSSQASPQTASSKAPAPARVDVVTTFASWNATSGAVEVGGYAAVVERAGTCTLRLIRGDHVVTREHPASTDATTVACGAFSVPRNAITAGQWQAVLAYVSSTSAGEAAAVKVEVP